jgi:hypothetical protein
MSSFGSAGRFGGRVVGKAVGVRRKLSVADEKKVRSKLKAAAYTQGGVDWHKLFNHYDRDNSGEIGMVEFKRLLRSDAKIPVSQLSDTDVKSLFNSIDTDGSGEIDADEFLVWVKGGDEEDGINGKDSSRGSPNTRGNSSGYGRRSPSELSSPSQRRFDIQKGWLFNNNEHSEAEGALIAQQEEEQGGGLGIDDASDRSGDDTFDHPSHENTKQTLKTRLNIPNVPIISPNGLKRVALAMSSSSASLHKPRGNDARSAHTHYQKDYMNDNDDRIHHSAQRAIDEAESSLANSNRVNSIRLSNLPTMEASTASIDTEASIDALLQLQREKDHLTHQMRRLTTDTKNKDDALEEAAAAVVESQKSAQQSDHEADAWHRVVVEQKTQLQRVLDDSSDKEQMIQMQAEQLRALKILVEARASSSFLSETATAPTAPTAPTASLSPHSTSPNNVSF